MSFNLRAYEESTNKLTTFNRSQRLGLGLSPIEFFFYRGFLKAWRLLLKNRAEDSNDLVRPLFPVPAATERRARRELPNVRDPQFDAKVAEQGQRVGRGGHIRRRVCPPDQRYL